MPRATRVYLEKGKTWTFACAVDWPGWCRRGKGAQEALDVLDDAIRVITRTRVG